MDSAWVFYLTVYRYLVLFFIRSWVHYIWSNVVFGFSIDFMNIIKNTSAFWVMTYTSAAFLDQWDLHHLRWLLICVYRDLFSIFKHQRPLPLLEIIEISIKYSSILKQYFSLPKRFVPSKFPYIFKFTFLVNIFPWPFFLSIPKLPLIHILFGLNKTFPLNFVISKFPTVKFISAPPIKSIPRLHSMIKLTLKIGVSTVWLSCFSMRNII